MLTANEVSLRLYAEDVQDLWRRNLAGMSHFDPATKLRLGYLENPAGHGVCIALKADDCGAMAGVICLHPRSMYRGATVLRAANLADFAVDASFRTLGPALILMKEAVSVAGKRALLLYGLPNRNSAAVCRRAGLNILEGGIRRYACALTGQHPRVQSWPLAWLLKPALDLALRVADAWRMLTLKPCLHCVAATLGDSAIDAIWAQRPPDLLLGERGAAMMQWRYGRTGRGDWNATLVRTSQGQFVGLLIWRLKSGVADISDFYNIAPSRLTASMLNAFCRFAREHGAHSVSLEFFGAKAVVDQIARAGLLPRGEASIVVVDARAVDAPDLADAERWYLTAFDSDAN